MAPRSAMARAPRATQTWRINGSAMGTAPTTRDSDTRRTREKGSRRTLSWKRKTSSVTASVATMTYLTIARIWASKRPTGRGPLFAEATVAAARPISVLAPVATTRNKHSPRTTTQPASIRRSPSPRGTVQGTGSPVSADVSTLIVPAPSEPPSEPPLTPLTPLSHSPSAGTACPPRRATTSPGTSSSTSSDTARPSRLTDTNCRSSLRSASRALDAFISSRKATVAFTTSIVEMIPKSSHSSTAALKMHASSSMNGIVPVNCRRNSTTTDRSSSGTAFRP
mmetsp:Transcript_34210/g.109871  ORF Transcript_34210/g.109871 Transcript_34210/m.109871 type:complete len:281 (+) Transcript_34210:455-1297(+)